MKRIIYVLLFLSGCISSPKKDLSKEVSVEKKESKIVEKTNLYDLFLKYEKEYAFEENVIVQKVNEDSVEVLLKTGEIVSYRSNFILQKSDVVLEESLIKGLTPVTFSCVFDKYGDEAFLGKDYYLLSENSKIMRLYSKDQKYEFLVSVENCKIEN